MEIVKKPVKIFLRKAKTNHHLAKIFLFLDKILGYKYEKYKFYKAQGYKLNLRNPKTFNEKIVYKKLNDDNPLIPIIVDKYEVRNYIKELIGEERANEILIPLLHVTNNPNDIPFNDLPDKFIVKSNHGSGQIMIITPENNKSKKEIINKCYEWLNEPYKNLERLWFVSKINRKILIEKLLIDSSGNIPKDYKFHVFNGKCELVHVIFDKYNNNSTKKSFYDRKWNKLNVVKGRFEQGDEVDKPNNSERMFLLAEELGQEFDFIRVDLYEIDSKIYFGELTPYPSTGRAKFEPQTFDFELGSYLKLNN